MILIKLMPTNIVPINRLSKTGGNVGVREGPEVMGIVVPRREYPSHRRQPSRRELPASLW
jgi:hypothetical protein